MSDTTEATLLARLESLEAIVKAQAARIEQLQTVQTATAPAEPTTANRKVSRKKMLKGLAVAAAGVAATTTALATSNNDASAAFPNQSSFSDTGTPTAVVDVTATSNAANATAILGFASASTGSTYGIRGVSSSTSGIGVNGNANAGTGFTIGVRGETNSTGGVGVYANAYGGSGQIYGVQAFTNSPNGIGVYAVSDFYGIYGVTNSNSGVAVNAKATAASGSTFGVAGESASSTGTGVLGTATANTGGNTGVWGTSSSTTGVGVYGQANNGWGGRFTGGRAPLILDAAATAGAPSSNFHLRGELFVDNTGALFYCTTSGTPGTWVRVSNGLVQGTNITLTQNIDGTTTIAAANAPAAVNSLNGLTNAVVIRKNGTALTATGQNLDVNDVASLNGVTGAVKLQVNGTDVTPNGQIFNLSIPNGGGTTTSVNGLSGAVVIRKNGTALTATGQNLDVNDVASLNGVTGAVKLQVNGTDVTPNGQIFNLSIPNGGGTTTSVNGLSGAVVIRKNGTALTATGQNLDVNDVASLNGLSGAVKLQVNGADVTPNGQTINITTPTVPTFSNVVFLASPVRVVAAFSGGDLLNSDGSSSPSATFKSYQVTGSSTGIPAGAKGIIGSLTSVGAKSSGNLRLWATGGSVPTVNTLNIPFNTAAASGFNLTTAFTVALSSDGKVNVGFSGAAGATCGFALDVVAYIV